MKKRIVIALIATLTLTLGSFGTAFAMNSAPVIELQTNETLKQGEGGETTDPEEPEEHTHTWGNAYYVKDQDAEYEKVKVVDKPAEYEQIKVVDKEAVYEQVKVWDEEPWDEEITELHTICYGCADKGVTVIMDGWDFADIQAHMRECGSGSYGSREIVVDTIHHEGKFHYENGALISPEEFHYENGALISPEEFHYEDKLVKPEKGHWEHICADCGEVQNRDTGEVIKPGTLPEEPTEPSDPSEPSEPSDPTDPSEPSEPEVKPGEDIETPDEDTEKPDQDTVTDTTDNDKQDQQENADKTAQTTDNKEQADTTTTAVSSESTVPQTGDTASLIYLASLAGGALTGGTALTIKRKFTK